MPADIHPVEKNGVFDTGEAVDPDAGSQDRLPDDLAPGDDAARADHAVQGVALRRGSSLPRTRISAAAKPAGRCGSASGRRTGSVGLDRDQIHIGLVVGIQRPHIAPVGGLAVGFRSRNGKANTGCESMIAGMMSLPKSCGLSCELASSSNCSNRNRGCEHVDAHRRQAVRGSPGIGLGLGGFSSKPMTRLSVSDLHHAELPGCLLGDHAKRRSVRSAWHSLVVSRSSCA